jgi:protocatechuate 3,4-dioxygenase alpha subunit
MSDASPLVATASQTVGPFFHFGLTAEARGRLVPRPAAEPITLLVSVTDGDGCPVPDAMVELWQASGSVSAFGRMPTKKDGTCEFETASPGPAPAGSGVQQAPHINVCLFARGLLRHLYTRMYFAGDPALDGDPVLALVPADRRRTLLATPDETQPRTWRFNVRLQGSDETVFFDA